jgi:Mrp family chromosome partitioning ATPase
MSVITVASSKGGPGKTTLCQLLVAGTAGRMQVVLLDADPTGAASRWAANAYEGPTFEALVETDEARLAHLIAAKAEVADLVVVDTAGCLSQRLGGLRGDDLQRPASQSRHRRRGGRGLARRVAWHGVAAATYRRKGVTA